MEIIKKINVDGKEYEVGGSSGGSGALKLKLVAEYTAGESDSSEIWIENAQLKLNTAYILEYYSYDVENVCCMTFIYAGEKGYRWDMFDDTGENYFWISNDGDSIYIATNYSFVENDQFKFYELGGIE